jgi:hypothetical protein
MQFIVDIPDTAANRLALDRHFWSHTEGLGCATANRIKREIEEYFRNGHGSLENVTVSSTTEL